MVTLASILNPEPPRSPLPASRPAPDSPVSLAAISTDETAQTAGPTGISIMARDSKSTARPRGKGVVNFHPFEHGLSESSMAEIRRFQVSHFGTIHQNCRRIPYNSGKKQFYQKTGRDCFEVFQYDFKLEGESEPRWTVMWDYQIGLVRVTPFFKALKYPKTMPAKMINQNPGLKDITHSITGGSIPAQGYWMPFDCAKAVCATFCYDIAGALIPVFGPDFPSMCIPREMPGFGRFTISPDTIEKSSRQAEIFRRMYSPYGIPPSPRRTGSVSPRRPLFQLRRDHSADGRQHSRSSNGLVNTAYGASLGADGAMSPGGPQMWARGVPRSHHAGIESTVTTPRSAAGRSPEWTAANNQHILQYHTHHTYTHNDDLSNGSGQLHNKLTQILTGSSFSPPYGSGQHSPGYPRLAPLLQNPGLPCVPSQHQNQYGRRDYDYTDGHVDYGVSSGAVESRNRDGPATTWPAEARGIVRDAPSNTVPAEGTWSNRVAAENDAAMVLMHLRLPDPTRQRDFAGDKSVAGSHSSVEGEIPAENTSLLASSAPGHTGFAPHTPVPTEAPPVKKRRATLV